MWWEPGTQISFQSSEGLLTLLVHFFSLSLPPSLHHNPCHPPPRAAVYYRGVFTAFDCAPVTEHIIRQDGLDISQSDIINYYNIVLGISNPSVFDVPPACTPISEKEMFNMPRFV